MRGSDEQPGYLFSYVSAEARVPAGSSAAAGAARSSMPRCGGCRRGSTRCMCGSGVPRLRRRSCCAPCCCRCCTPSAASGSWSSSCNTTCCFSGSSGCRSMMRCGMRRRSRRIAIACSTGDIAEAFFQEVLAEARAQGLLSTEHFTVDGTLLEAWASQKSFRPRDEDGPRPAGRR